MNLKFKAVFFDVGETLLSPHPSFHVLFGEVLRDLGHEVPAARVQQVFESFAPTMVEVMDRVQNSGGGTCWSTSAEASRKFWGEVYNAGLSELGIEDPAGVCASALYERFTRFESYRLFPDVLPTLNRLKDSGLKVGLISNFEEWLEGMLIEMQVDHLFDWMVISGKEGIEKPDPAIFQMALNRSGVTAETAVYVGDHPRIDAEAATAVGMTGVLIDRRGRHLAHRGLRIETLDQLPALL